MLVKGFSFLFLLIFVFGLQSWKVFASRYENSSEICAITVLLKELKTLNATDRLDEILDDIHQGKLVNDIEIAIKSHEFAVADSEIIKLLKSGTNSSVITAIVHDVYDNHIGNFGLLHRYAQISRSAVISCKVLLALWFEMQMNLHIDPVKLCHMIETLSEKMNNLDETDNLLKLHVKDILESEIHPQIVVTLSRKFISTLRNDTYHFTQDLADIVFAANESLFDDIIGKVINETYGKKRMQKLLHVMWSHKNTAQKASGLIAIFRKSSSNLKKNSDEILLIADYFRQLMALKDFSQLNKFKQIAVEQFINACPQPVFVLYFRKKICFQHSETKEYLYASSPFNEWRHEMSTSLKIENGTEWYPDPQGGLEFKFRNIFYENENLFAADNPRILRSKNRKVFTWLSYGNVGELNSQLIWRIKVNTPPNEIELINDAYNELLCAAMLEEHGYVFSMERERIYKNKLCRWLVMTC